MGWRVIQGDCLSMLPSYADGQFDHVMTDPPYSPRTHAGARTTTDAPGLEVVPLVDFAPLDGETFLGFCRQCVRVSKRWVIMFCDWRHAALAEDAGLPVIRLGVWVKPDAAPQFSGDRPGVGWEAVMILHRPGRKRWKGGGHHAVWVRNVERGSGHPTQKPVRLLREWVRLFTSPGERILDPYGGSGTTGVAAVAEGRSATVIEVDPRWCEVARDRIGREYRRVKSGLRARPRTTR